MVGTRFRRNGVSKIPRSFCSNHERPCGDCEAACRRATAKAQKLCASNRSTSTQKRIAHYCWFDDAGGKQSWREFLAESRSTSLVHRRSGSEAVPECSQPLAGVAISP